MSTATLNFLDYPQRHFAQDLREVLRGAAPEAYLRLTFVPGASVNRWLVRRWDGLDPLALRQQRETELWARARQHDFNPDEIILTARPATAPIVDEQHLLYDPLADAHLYLGTGAWEGYVSGYVRTPQGIEPLHQLNLPGPKMLRHTSHTDEARAALWPAQEYERYLSQPATVERWSRTIAALGQFVWHRLCALKIGIVGCGRNGELIAKDLADLGVGRLTLIDPDTVETHNLGEMSLVTEDDLGQPKAAAVARHLRARMRHAPVEYRAFHQAVTNPEAVSALAQDCEVIICAVDNDAARLSTALIAAAYHKVLLDVGTGIFHDAAPGHLRQGAEVRLIIPGDGCLLCWGGVTDANAALAEMFNPQPRADFRQERAGSLQTLNRIAANEALQLLQNLCAGQLTGSTWVRYDTHDAGRQRTVITPPQTAGVCMCKKAGAGGLNLLG